MSLVTDLQLSYALAWAESSYSAQSYLKHVVINSDPAPKRFSELAEPWQWDRANYVLPAVESVTGHNPGYQGPKNIWEVMPRGHDKTSFIARIMSWVLCFSKRKNLRLLVAAKDGDQANILKDCMQTEASLNPWFGGKLDFFQKTVRGPCGNLRIATADALGLFGHGIDIFVMEEITHWEDVLGQQVWTSLWSGREKRPSAVLLVLSNAGYLDTWQHKIFEVAKGSPRWYVFEAPGILASWMNKAAIEDDRLLLPPAEAERLLDNRWIDPGAADSYLTKAEVQACETASRELGITWTPELDKSKEYILSLDYGPRKDRTAICLGHQIPTGELLVDRFWVWEGRDYEDGEVPISRIRELIESLRAEAPQIWIVLDPYQLKELAQYYQHHLPVEVFEARGGKGNFEMAECLRHQIINKRLLWPPGVADLRIGVPGAGTITEGILEELPRLILKRMSYGYRFDHLSGRHDDRACALGMMCVAAFNRPKPEIWIQNRRHVIHKQEEKRKNPDPFRNRGSQDRQLWGVKV